jgi:hypothetical protein
MNSQFKFKPDKIKYLSNIDTLDSNHKKIVDNIVKKREDLPKQIKKLEKLNDELKELDSKSNETFDYVNIRAKIIEEIKIIEDEMKSIENYEEETEYYSKTYHILFNYYDILDGQLDQEINDDNISSDNLQKETNPEINKQINTESNKNIRFKEEHVDKEDKEEKEINKKNDDEWNFDGVQIFNTTTNKLDLLNEMSKTKRKEKKTTRKRVKNVESLIKNNNYNIFHFIDSKNNVSTKKNTEEVPQIENNNDYNVKDRAVLYEDYKTLIEGYSFKKKYNKTCLNCNIDKVLLYSEGIYACMKCGDVEHCIIENESANYKDPMIEKPTFPYKRKNHFCEWNLLNCSLKLLIKRVASLIYNL